MNEENKIIKFVEPCGCHYYFAEKRYKKPTKKDIIELYKDYKKATGTSEITIFNTIEWYKHLGYIK